MGKVQVCKFHQVISGSAGTTVTVTTQPSLCLLVKVHSRLCEGRAGWPSRAADSVAMLCSALLSAAFHSMQ